MNKLVKILVIVNGFLMPIVFGLIIFSFVKDSKEDNNYNYEYSNEGVIIGDELSKAKEDNVALQGLNFDNPRSISNSSNYYLPISVTTFNEARELQTAIESAGDFPLWPLHIMNVIFMDKDYRVIGNLVNKKASIIDIEIPHSYDKSFDENITNIAYLIGYNDSNQDGKLSHEDYHDLYLSDLSGQNLIQATQNIDIQSYDFIKSNTKILIKYNDRNNLKKEHQKVKFGIFDIELSKFEELSELNDSIESIDNQLIN